MSLSRARSRASYALLATIVCLGVPGCEDEGVPPDFTWQAVQENLPGSLLSIWGTSATDVYSVGSDAQDGGGPLAMHFDGQRWTRIDTTLRRGALWWVHGTDANTVWMVGEGGAVLRYNPTMRRAERMATPGRETLFGVWGQSSNDVWAVGGNLNAGAGEASGVIWHFDGAAWSNVALPGTLSSRVLYKVWGNAANDVWVCGANGTTIHYDGTAWRAVDVPTAAVGPLFTVHGRGASRYAVGGNASGLILENDGNGWRQAPVDGAPRLNGVYVPATGSPIAVGQQGTLYMRRSAGWQEVARPPRTDQEFHSVWIDPTGAVWGVGGNIQSTPMGGGMIWRFGTRIATTPLVTPSEITTCPERNGNRGMICTVAGTGVAGYNGDDRPARETELYWPMDVAFLRDNTPIVIDWNNHLLRRVAANGNVQTIVGTPIAGDGPEGGTGDLVEPGVPGLTVALNHPTDMLLDDQGRLLFVAWHNHKIRRWDPATGNVFVTIGRGPGNTGDNGPAAMALLRQPSKAVRDRAGNMYILDQGNGRIRRVGTDGMMTLVAGMMGGRAFAGDGGPALAARFNWQGGENPEPEGGLALDPTGRYLYIADSGNQRIRRIDLMDNTIATVIGDGTPGYAGDNGPGLMARVNSPNDMAFGPDGLLYIADTNNHRIRTYDPMTDRVQTVVGTGVRGYSGDRGDAREAQLWRPYGVNFDNDGNLWIADTYNNRLRRVWR